MLINNDYSVLGVIPARLASTRLPGKPLKEICGKSLLQRVYEQCLKSKLLQRVVIVTDHPLIVNHAKSFDAEVILSNKEHLSGTDRIAELVESFPKFSHVINVQGDEPFIDPDNIDLVVKILLEKNCNIASLAQFMSDSDKIENPGFVKVVTDNEERALYFSRAAIPFLREANTMKLHQWKKHIGIYGFKREVIMAISKLPPSVLELIESLEQLRWLQNGYQIHIGIIDYHANGVDTPEDLIEAIRFAELHNL